MSSHRYPLLTAIFLLVGWSHANGSSESAPAFRPLPPDDLELTSVEQLSANALGHYAWGYYLSLDDTTAPSAVEREFLSAIADNPESDFLIHQLLRHWARHAPGQETERIITDLAPIGAAHPTAVGLNLVVANALLYRKQFDHAEAILSHLLKHTSWSQPRVIREWIFCYLEQNQPSKAHRLIQRAMRPNRLRGNYLIEQTAALFYDTVAYNMKYRLSRLTRAKYQRLAYEHALRAAGASAALTNYTDAMNLANLLYKADLLPQTLAVVKAIDENGYGDEQSQRIMATCYERLERWSEAVMVWQDLVNDYPFRPTLYYRLGRALRAAGEPAAALRHFGAAFRLRSSSIIAYEIAATYVALDEPDKALLYVKQASHTRLSTYLLRSRIYRQLGDLDSALSALHAARDFATAKERPDFLTVRYYIALANVQRLREQPEAVIAALERAFEIEPDNAMVLNFLGYFLAVRNKQLRRAEKLIRRALDHEPNNAAYLDSLAWVLFRRGRFRRAAEAITRSIELGIDGRDPVILDHAGDIFHAYGDTEKAIHYWRLALDNKMADSERIRRKLEAAESQ